VFAGAGAAQADTIDFSQFGPPGTILTSPLTGVTTNGVSVTLRSPQQTFETFVQAPQVSPGDDTWQGALLLAELGSLRPHVWDGGALAELSQQPFASACDSRRPTIAFATFHLPGSSWPSVKSPSSNWAIGTHPGMNE
jgi:hypothetical protein